MAIADPSLKGRNARSLSNLLVYPRFQLPLIGFNVGLTALSLLVVWMAANDGLSAMEAMAAQSSTDADFFHKVLAHHAERLHTRFFIAGFLAMSLSGAVTLYISHKIAGPMVAMRHFFRKLRDGAEPTPELHFRDRDFLMDLPPLVNDAIAALKARSKKKSA